MLDNITKKNIDDCRDVLVGKVPDPKSQIEQITLALIYKFMDDMDREAVEKYKGKAKFFTGEFAKYGWRKLFDPSLNGKDMLELYSGALEKLQTNPNIPELFRNIFKNAYLPYKDPSTLKLFLKHINIFEYTHSEKLGDAFEYLLSVMGSQGDAGQFRTPRHIIDFLVACVNPLKNETIADPACGTAGFLLSAYNFILNDNTEKRLGDKLTPEQRKKLAENIIGYDISPDMVRLSLANMYLHGFPTPKVVEYDTLSSEERWDENFDVILANPPFMTPKGGIRPHNRFGIKANRAEILFFDYIVEHLQNNCKSGFIIPEGVLHNDGNAYKSLRKKIITDNYLYAVIELPHGVFKPYASVKTHIVLLDKSISSKKKDVLFIQIADDGFSQTDARKPNKSVEVDLALKLVSAFKKGQKLSVKGLKFNYVSKEDLLADKKISLIGRRYKAIRYAELSKFPAVKLTSELITVLRGLSPTQNTLEGDYTFVVTAKDKRTADHFDYECKAVCIPTVSSTGHGHASVRRLHYIEGKFALANIMCAVSVVDENKINPKYLYYVLYSMKDEILASLMTGTSNVSLDPEDIYDLEIPLPDIKEQNNFVKKQQLIEKKIIDLQNQIDSSEKIVQEAAKEIWN